MDRDEFAIRFQEAFCGHFSQNQLKNLGVGTGCKEFLWNIFAGSAVPCLVGNAARDEYNRVNKLNAEEIVYDNFGFVTGDIYSCKLPHHHMTAEGIDESGLVELYVVGHDFSWCYVITHEMDLCGPFFSYNPNNA